LAPYSKEKDYHKGNLQMKERVLSGAVLVLLVAAVVVFHNTFPFALNIAVGAITVLAVYELIAALGLQRSKVIVMASAITSAIIPMVFDQRVVFIVYCAYTAVLFSCMIRYHEEITFREIAVVYSMVILIPLALRTLVTVRDLGGAHGMFYTLIAIIASWASDAGAYFAGTLFGKHKLCPKISPKKTVEGVVGGVVVNVAAMLLCGFIFSQFFYSGQKHSDYLMLAIIGFFGSFTSILGDLSFSLIKRSCHIKDFGQVIPGHGGILDRFDSVIFTAPFVYLLVSYFPLVYKIIG